MATHSRQRSGEQRRARRPRGGQPAAADKLVPPPQTQPAGNWLGPAASPAFLLGLQRTIGNQALGRLLAGNSDRPDAVVQRALHTANGINYETEGFGGAGRERPKRVRGGPAPHAVGGRGQTPTSLALLHNPANPAAGKDTLLGYDGGHVLGLSLGGADASYNVVPMLPGFNRGTWKAVESNIENDTLFAYSGMNYSVRIELTYAGANDQIPQSLSAVGFADVPVKGKGKAKGKTVGTVHKQVKDYGTKSQPADIPVTPRLSAPEEDIVTQNQPPKTLRAIKKAAAKFMQDVQQEQEIADEIKTSGHLPASTRASYPDAHAERPYEYLDILTFSGKLDPGTTFGDRREFTSTQRRLILQANMAAHGGVLQSDDPADPIYAPPHNLTQLSEHGSVNFPEIDHIIPKSLGGSNMFSNARVVSWLLNNKEARVKNITGLVDTTRLSLPAMGSGTIADKVGVAIPALLMRATGPKTLNALAQDLAQHYGVVVTQAWRLAIQNVLNDMLANNQLTQNPLTQAYTVV